MKPITEKSGLDITIEKVSMWLDRDYLKAWFAWLEWVGLIVLLCVGAEMLNSFALDLLTFGCIVLLFCVGLVYIEINSFNCTDT